MWYRKSLNFTEFSSKMWTQFCFVYIISKGFWDKLKVANGVKAWNDKSRHGLNVIFFFSNKDKGLITEIEKNKKYIAEGICRLDHLLFPDFPPKVGIFKQCIGNSKFSYLLSPNTRTWARNSNSDEAYRMHQWQWTGTDFLHLKNRMEHIYDKNQGRGFRFYMYVPSYYSSYLLVCIVHTIYGHKSIFHHSL